MGSPTWVLTKGLQTVRAEFNTVFSDRDKTSDGSVGDLAHQQESASGHNPDITGRAEYKDGDKLNEVRAIDVDADLRDRSGNKVTMERAAQYLVKRARAGVYVPFRYLIFNGRIWSRSDGWKTRKYTGKNKHDKHAHFSGDYTQKADNWTGSLGLAGLTRKAVPVGVDLNANQTNIDAVYNGVNKAATLTRYFTGSSAPYAVTNTPASYGFAGGISNTQAFTAQILSELRLMVDKVDDLTTEVALLRADTTAVKAVTTKLDLDPADEPPQLNPIVIATRYAIANP